LISTSDGGEWLASRAGRFTPGKDSDNNDLYNVSQKLFTKIFGTLLQAKCPRRFTDEGNSRCLCQVKLSLCSIN
jgi:hypothetical protein